MLKALDEVLLVDDEYRLYGNYLGLSYTSPDTGLMSQAGHQSERQRLSQYFMRGQ